LATISSADAIVGRYPNTRDDDKKALLLVLYCRKQKRFLGTLGR
jgi:hypothetical protein